jgi:hypothetical protein
MKYKIPEEQQQFLAFAYYQLRQTLGLPEDPLADWHDAGDWLVIRHYAHIKYLKDKQNPAPSGDAEKGLYDTQK